MMRRSKNYNAYLDIKKLVREVREHYLRVSPEVDRDRYIAEELDHLLMGKKYRFHMDVEQTASEKHSRVQLYSGIINRIFILVESSVVTIIIRFDENTVISLPTIGDIYPIKLIDKDDVSYPGNLFVLVDEE